MTSWVYLHFKYLYRKSLPIGVHLRVPLSRFGGGKKVNKQNFLLAVPRGRRSKRCIKSNMRAARAEQVPCKGKPTVLVGGVNFPVGHLRFRHESARSSLSGPCSGQTGAAGQATVEVPVMNLASAHSRCNTVRRIQRRNDRVQRKRVKARSPRLLALLRLLLLVV